jgi:NTP pyrophosphatase (non-canonical NTP hydrolase)
MNRTEHLLVCLAEECAEVGQAVGKALRFGLTDSPPGGGLQNDKYIVRELHDVLAVLELLTECGALDRGHYGEEIREKKEKVERFMRYAEERGTLVSNVQGNGLAGSGRSPLYASPC